MVFVSFVLDIYGCTIVALEELVAPIIAEESTEVERRPMGAAVLNLKR